MQNRLLKLLSGLFLVLTFGCGQTIPDPAPLDADATVEEARPLDPGATIEDTPPLDPDATKIDS